MAEQITLEKVLDDPEFHAVPIEEKLKFLRGTFPDFAAMHPTEQGKLLLAADNKMRPSQAPEKPEDKGFWSTLGGDLASLPEALRHPLDTIANATEARRAQQPQAAKAWKEGDVLGAAGHGMAGAMPFIGPMAAQAGEEFGNGQYGQGLAHALELLGPSAVKGGMALGNKVAPGAMRPINAAVEGASGAAKGAWEGAKTKTKFSWPGYIATHSATGSAPAGVAAGYIAPKVVNIAKGAAQGFKKGLAKPSKPALKLAKAIESPELNPDILNPPVEPPEQYGVSKPQPTGLKRMARTTDDLNPIEPEEKYRVADPRPTGIKKMSRTTDDLNPIEPEVPEDKYRVDSPKPTGIKKMSRTTDDLNPVEAPEFSTKSNFTPKKLPKEFWRSSEDLNPEAAEAEAPEAPGPVESPKPQKGNLKIPQPDHPVVEELKKAGFGMTMKNLSEKTPFTPEELISLEKNKQIRMSEVPKTAEGEGLTMPDGRQIGRISLHPSTPGYSPIKRGLGPVESPRKIMTPKGIMDIEADKAIERSKNVHPNVSEPPEGTVTPQTETETMDAIQRSIDEVRKKKRQ